MTDSPEPFDIFIIGGGINGCGIARDAAGRGYRVGLAEMNDLASATSSASTKLFHGGLRYLEFFEFRLVREALREREILLRAMPHISWPMRFVLPFHKDMRFDTETPASRVLSFVMPWMKGRRPAWLIRFGLFLYDHLGGREILPGTETLSLKASPEGAPLAGKFAKAFEYSDCWVDDARLVLLNAVDARAKGAEITLRTEVISAIHANGMWRVQLRGPDGDVREIKARMLVNASGPWVEQNFRKIAGSDVKEKIRLVRGSHIVTRKLFDHEKCYFFQGEDGRIIFAIPYQVDFTLIGTTDADHEDPGTKPQCTEEEKTYLIRFANQYFSKQITESDIVWSFSGMRPLYNDGASSATAATRDYVLRVDHSTGGAMLNVFGGKITTYRRLAETALDLIDGELDRETTNWTADAALPGGDFPVAGFAKLHDDLANEFPFIDPKTIKRMARQYGTGVADVLSGATNTEDLGKDFGHGIYEKELQWTIDKEWVTTAEDFLWRRTKLGLLLNDQEVETIEKFILERAAFPNVT